MDESKESVASDLQCGICSTTYAGSQPQLVCACGGPLEQRYDFSKVGCEDRPASEPDHEHGVWRYRRLLPKVPRAYRRYLGEGQTPLVELRTWSRRLAVRMLIKEEGLNPTGSYKARGASVGAARLAYLGWRSLAVPTSGSGGSAWAAYAAAAGLKVSVGLPRFSDSAAVAETMPTWYGASVDAYEDDLEGAYKRFRAQVDADSAYLAGFREPYRVEGDKTLLYELVEQLGWHVPDQLVFPTGGGIGLVAQAKALGELHAAGWLGSDERTTFVAAQHKECAPIADALLRDLPEPERSMPRGTPITPGVWVADPHPGPYILQRLRQHSGALGGTADSDQIRECMRSVARTDGVLLGPEGALGVSVAKSLIQAGAIQAGDTVVCVNTGSALRYPHLLASS